MMVHEHHNGLRYWRWVFATLCPPCRAARYDWVMDPRLRNERVFV